MIIDFIRHAESIFNKNPNDTTPNCGLTLKGIQQSKQLSGNYDCIYISPLKRAKQTLYYSKLRNQYIIETDLLREVKRDPCDFFKHEPVDKENYEDVIIRAKKANTFIRDNNYSKIAVISHWEIIWYMTNYELDLNNTERISLYQ